MNQISLRKLRSLIIASSMSVLSACAMSTPDYKSVVSDPDRPANERELDAARKPDEVLAFYGVESGDKVADLWAGRGYYTAILSQVVGPQGVVYSANPNSSDANHQRW